MRFKFIFLFVGLGLMFWGFQEFNVSRGASKDPVAVELAKLEAGEALSNNHIQLDQHFAVWDELIFEYEQSNSSSGQPDGGTKVNFAYYPVISLEHPFTKDLANQIATQAENAEVTLPRINTFTVLVKTKQFKTVGELPGGIDVKDSVQGLVVNRIKKLDKKEAELIKQSFPSLDLDKVLILEQDRKPSPLAKSGGIMFGGLVLVLAAVGMFFMKSKE